MMLSVGIAFLLVNTNWSAKANETKVPITRSGNITKEPIKLYYSPPSLPCRAAMMTARAVGLELDLRLTDVRRGDHVTPEFLTMNPQHNIPTMDDNGFIIWESHAIMAYFVNAYGKKDDPLYPNNPRLRALVDARLNFDLGCLYPRYLQVYSGMAFSDVIVAVGTTFSEAPMIARDLEPESGQKADLNEALDFLESMLTGRKYVAGENITIADISIITTITTLNALKYNLEAYPLVNAWFERTKLVLEPFGYTEIDHAGGKIIESMIYSSHNNGRRRNGRN